MPSGLAQVHAKSTAYEISSASSLDTELISYAVTEGDPVQDYCRAGCCGFNPQDQTNAKGLQITEKRRYYLCLANS